VYGQGGESTLTGTVRDSSGAIIPKANVTLIDQATGERRVSQSNTEGFFAFTAVRPATYTVDVAIAGFSQYEQKDIVVRPAQQVGLGDLILQIGNTSSRVEVTAQSNLIPTDTPEKGADITAQQIQNLAIEGRNVVELLSIVPGAVNFGGYSGEVINIQGGTNDFAINGIRPDSISTLLDGADVEDPGCNCGAFATLNRELISEVKIQTSNFGAETVKGPVVFQAISKSGTRDFHGEAYYTVRDSVLNSNDASFNANGLAKPDTRYQFPGFNVGGPVIIPGTGFNKDRQKLFFFGGLEWQYQRLAPTAAQAFVPTSSMLNGDFNSLVSSPLPKESGVSVISPPCDPTKGALASYCSGPYRLAPSAIDPRGLALLKLFPAPNVDPATHNGANYASGVPSDDNRVQGMIRVDYNVSDKMKIYARYNQETESPSRAYGVWWTGNVPYPGNIQGKNNGKSLSTSLVNIFSPTVTNEVVVAVGRLVFGNTLGNPKAVDPVAVGFGSRAAFPFTGGIVPNTFLGDSFNTNFETAGGWANGENPAKKWVNSVADNFSVVRGTHLLKFGMYYQYITNDQRSPHPGGAWAQGEIDEGITGNPLTSGNSIADLLLGTVKNFSQASGSPPGILAQNETTFYGQDSWKITPRLTLTYGVRVYHLGWMYDKNNNFAVFIPAAYQGPLCATPGVFGCGTGPGQNPYVGGNAPLSAFSGLQTNARNPAVPRSGAPTPLAEFGPRFGFAYDVTGKGDWVLRGGFGTYYNHDRNNPVYDAMSNPPLVNTYNSPAPTTLSNLIGIVPGAVKNQILVIDPANENMPYVYQYSFTISHRLPWQSSMEVSYIGNSSHNQQVSGFNINYVPYGAIRTARQAQITDNTVAINNDAYRLYGNYSGIQYVTNFVTANYNGLQITAQKQAGRFNFSAAYTFSKALGTGTGQNDGGNAVAPTDARHLSYGPLQYDRTHLAQFSYIYRFPNLRPDVNRFARGVANNWEISGITILQSGAPITAGQLGGAMSGVDQLLVTGSPDYNAYPLVTCNPTANLAPRQLYNASCFAPPTATQNGPAELPYYIRGPWYTNTNLSLHKEFRFTESRGLEFRFETINAFNHPLWTGYNNGLFSGSSNVGYENLKTGNRVVQLSAKFLF
jgi:hypothetical protein